jgi:hypothetical protein
MKFQQFLVRTGLILPAAALLAACDTMSQSVDTVKQKVSGISMPDFSNMFTVQKDNAPIPCPPVTLVEELRAVHQFENPVQPKPGEQISNAYFDSVSAQCTRTGNNLVMQIALNLRGDLGVANKKSQRPSFSYPYFIAVMDPNGNILAKEIFASNLSYDSGSMASGQSESIREIIPLADGVNPESYSVMIGFQLSDSELAYNRSLMSAQLPPSMTPVAPVPSVEKAPVKKAAATKKKAAKKKTAAKAEVKTETKAAPAAEAAPVPAPAPAAAPAVTPADAAKGTAPVYTDGPIVVPPTPEAPAPDSAPARMMDDELSTPPSVDQSSGDQNEVIFSSGGKQPTDITAP